MAVELSIVDFKLYFTPVFDDVSIFPETLIYNELEDSKLEVSEVVYGAYYRRAAYYLTAHLISIRAEQILRAQLAPGSTSVSASRGIMTSASVGDLSKTMEFPAYDRADDKFLASTVFGQEYLRLRNKMCRGGLIANRAVIDHGIIV